MKSFPIDDEEPNQDEHLDDHVNDRRYHCEPSQEVEHCPGGVIIERFAAPDRLHRDDPEQINGH